MQTTSLVTFVVDKPYGLWQNTFYRNDVNVNYAKVSEMKQYLAKQLADTRFSLQDPEDLFAAFAEKRAMSDQDALQIWEKIGSIIIDNIGRGRDNNTIDQTILIALKGSKFETNDMITLVCDFRKVCSRLIAMSVQYEPNNTNYLIGVMGELFAYLYARDIVRYDCIHHKLVLDSPSTFRHGMDLLGVKFHETDEYRDEIHFIEAKATSTPITSQRNEIINWFNNGLEVKANMMIDQAKRRWKSEYPSTIFRRASKALSRFLVSLEEISDSTARCVGSILIDEGVSPTDRQLLGFRQIKFPRKQLVIIKDSSLVELSREVFDLACTI